MKPIRPCSNSLPESRCHNQTKKGSVVSGLTLPLSFPVPGPLPDSGMAEPSCVTSVRTWADR